MKFFSLLIFSVLLLSFGCNRKHLAIFFDGVPPEIKEKTISADSVMITESDSAKNGKYDIAAHREKMSLSLHPAYQNKECAKCHFEQQGYRLKEKEPLLCNNCHIDYTKATPFVHGPVAAGICSACHLPHKSANKKLLIKPRDEICLYCHVSEDIAKNSVHKASTEKRCLKCHYAHGGQTILLLKNKKTKNEN